MFTGIHCSMLTKLILEVFPASQTLVEVESSGGCELVCDNKNWNISSDSGQKSTMWLLGIGLNSEENHVSRRLQQQQPQQATTAT